jgi:4-methylaminobutanoate oxidase (formaldehyde-forming)
VAIFDQSSFSKYLIQGNDACKVLQRICTANIDVAPGRIVYTHWLNERGGIEADLTVTRLAENRYMVVSGAAVTNRDLDWLSRNIPQDAHCFCTDVTAAWAVLGVMGPESRALIEKVTSADLSNEAFPFGTVQPVEIVGLVPAGMHALDSCRIEKKFLHFGHDIADEDSPIDAGMRFVCNFEKAIHFIGRDAVSAQLEGGGPLKKRLLQFLLEDPDAVLYHHEPILRDGATVGYLTSGGQGFHCFGQLADRRRRCADYRQGQSAGAV